MFGMVGKDQLEVVEIVVVKEIRYYSWLSRVI